MEEQIGKSLKDFKSISKEEVTTKGLEAVFLLYHSVPVIIDTKGNFGPEEWDGEWYTLENHIENIFENKKCHGIYKIVLTQIREDEIISDGAEELGDVTWFYKTVSLKEIFSFENIFEL